MAVAMVTTAAPGGPWMLPRNRPPDDKPEVFNDSPIAWFAELVLASDRRDVDRAAEAKAELARLGWTFKFRKPRPEADGQGVAK